MKKIKLIPFVISILLFASSYGQGTKSIDYGSNNGKYVTIKNTKIYYEEYGSGVPLLLLHGGLSSLSSFSTIIPGLSKRFRVIAVDGPGEGRSEMPDSISYKLEADYASEFIDKLKLDSVYVYGFSLGASTALQLAVHRPDKVKMGVIHAGVYDYSGWGPDFGGDKVTEKVMEQYPNIWLNDHLKKSPQPDQWKKYLVSFLKIWNDRAILSEAQLQTIKNPVLVVLGDKDLLTIDHAFRMHKLISKSQLCILPNTTHFVLWERPDLISTIVLDFLTKKKTIGSFSM